jgi:hypothetical protein
MIRSSVVLRYYVGICGVDVETAPSMMLCDGLFGLGFMQVALFRRHNSFAGKVPSLGSLEDCFESTHHEQAIHTTDPLESGDVIQLFHKDSDAYICAEGVSGPVASARAVCSDASQTHVLRK